MHTFHLFQPNNRKSFNKILFCLLLLGVFTSIFFILRTSYPFLKNLLFICILITSCYITYVLTTNKKRFDFVSGSFIGSIIFNEDGIILINHFIPYHQIKNITFNEHDYLGKYNKKALLKPSVSIGVSNKIKLVTIDGKEYNHQFQQQHDYELFKAFRYLDKTKTNYNWLNKTPNN